jgi:HEPN domain-containing protein
MKTQTAVEWLYETLWKQTDFSLPNNILEQAKEMEKQQIIDAWTDAKYCNTMGNEINYEDGEQYYNETFKKETH